MEPWIWSGVTRGGLGLDGGWCARHGPWVNSSLVDVNAVNGEVLGLNLKPGGGGSGVNNMDLVTKVKAQAYGSRRCAGTGRR
jgi:hypothetical protein